MPTSVATSTLVERVVRARSSMPPVDRMCVRSAGSSPEMVKLTSESGVQPNALVVVINQNADRPRNRRVAATLADENGTWQLEIHALTGDRLDVTQERDAVRSPPTTITVR